LNFDLAGATAASGSASGLAHNPTAILIESAKAPAALFKIQKSKFKNSTRIRVHPRESVVLIFQPCAILRASSTKFV